MENMPDPQKFVDQKTLNYDLKKSLKDWRRKVEIAEQAYRKAKVIIRQAGGMVEDLIAPDIERPMDN